MKKILALICITFFASIANAKWIKLSVNMTGIDSVSIHGVHVWGDFQSKIGLQNNWVSDSTQLFQEGSSTIYSTYLNIPAFTKYEYVFING
jgi:hypothetical protein